jgi:hypothetical protein
MHWSKFIRTFCFAAIFSAASFYLFIVLVDPYDSVPFSLPFEREPVSTNQRFSYPSLARKAEFDSAIIGTSTARLLKPERLNHLTGDNWVNLAMNSATAYEQMEMLKLFLRHHAYAKRVVIGIDDAWCRPGQEIQKFTFRPFPPWMYDDNRWNDLLYIFNDKSLENSVRLIEYWLGKREAKYDRTGFRDFTEDFGAYDGTTVNSRLYPGEGTPLYAASLKINDIEPLVDGEVQFASHALLGQTLLAHQLPLKLTLLYMPMHGSYVHRGRENYQRCKGSINRVVDKITNIIVIDRMRVDKMTSADGNYWDPLHFTSDVAKKLESAIAK